MIFIVLLQVAISFVAASLGIFNEYLDIHPYLEIEEEKRRYSGIFSGAFWKLFAEFFGIWFILFLNIVPISLLVTLEGVKFLQALMI